VLSGVVFLLFWWLDRLRTLPGSRFLWLFVDTHALSSERFVFPFFVVLAERSLLVVSGRFHIIERRGEVDLNICINDAYCAVFVFGFNLENVYLEFFPEDFDGDSIFLMKTGEIT
jgi:hypothetical protein